MNIRTCPHCNYKYPLRDYIKGFLFKFVWSEWKCKNCSKLITFNLNRRLTVASGFGLLFIAFSIIIESMFMNIFWWILFITMFIIGIIFIYTFDTFDKANARELTKEDSISNL
jgi:hypothetical protein